MARAGWRSGIFPHLSSPGPWFKSQQAQYVDRAFNSYLMTSVFPCKSHFGFPPTSNIRRLLSMGYLASIAGIECPVFLKEVMSSQSSKQRNKNLISRKKNSL